jgi:hypothetical protein
MIQILSDRPKWVLIYTLDLGPGGSAHDGEGIPNGVQGVAPGRAYVMSPGPFPMRGES